ncbi:TRAP transporter large permease subunit [Burkholderia guangdongensis]|uniref:TRAP transporter large permease subunit n=1 Tax=Burkholderia guangdongensis TaxID=1792500 RepID=UPI0015CB8E33|nr:TRAP transporter large permease subunit [Burkholderia guangdongensis]
MMTPTRTNEIFLGAHAKAGTGTWRNWLVALPTALLLLAAVAFATSSFLHARLLNLGETFWPGYNFLRVEMPKPACDPHANIDAQVAQAVAQARKSNADSLFDSGPVDPNAVRASLLDQRDQCRKLFTLYERNQLASQSLILRAYRSIELTVGALTNAGQDVQPYVLVLLILFCGYAGKLGHEHIALRLPVTALDYRVSAIAQAVVNLGLLASAIEWIRLDQGAGASVPNLLHWIWIAGFGVLSALCLFDFVKVPEKAAPGGNLGRALLTVPLYVVLGVLTLLWFAFGERYMAGAIVQVRRMVMFSDLYLDVALYIWAGVLLKETRLTSLIFEVLRPWKLAPELITIAVVLIAAVPTAYTGASGIFVLAIGGVIYEELRENGARRQLAMGAAAMSGSMGVVLNPCLMIVIISALNREVTTDQLFEWGSRIFMLSAVLFAIVVIATRRSSLSIASPRDALGPSLKALIPLIPYAAIAVFVVFLFTVILQTPFNEFSIPVVLPFILLGIIAFERWVLVFFNYIRKREPGAPRVGRVWPVVRDSTLQSSMSIGALLLLMAFAVSVGGAVERSGVMDLFPQHLGSVWLATAILVVTLVIVGMLIDPYGAIILVSSVIAGIAYRNGITPVHFWMITLVAFEVGYLMPPVALNHLLARQSIGEHEFEALRTEPREKSFYRRHERVLMPLVVMCTVLLIDAFGPLVYKLFA